jgi:soluble lytic murein transglycosylase
VNEWIKTYGDPRDNHIDQVDWIEHIPYRETRNYVMRVIESLHVYRIRISGKVEPIRLTKDLTRG